LNESQHLLCMAFNDFRNLRACIRAGVELHGS
jgi:hypothetical protein